MSYADKVFVDMCKDIIENGVSTEGEKVRPKWEDGEYAYTIKQRYCKILTHNSKTYTTPP